MMFNYRSTTTHPWEDVVDWCLQELGEFETAWYRLGRDIAAESSAPDIYYFASETDCAWFTLKWG